MRAGTSSRGVPVCVDTTAIRPVVPHPWRLTQMAATRMGEVVRRFSLQDPPATLRASAFPCRPAGPVGAFSWSSKCSAAGRVGDVASAGQPLRLLSILLAKPNEFVHRDAVVDEMWPEGAPRARRPSCRSRCPLGYRLTVGEGELHAQEFLSLAAAAGTTTDPTRRRELVKARSGGCAGRRSTTSQVARWPRRTSFGSMTGAGRLHSRLGHPRFRRPQPLTRRARTRAQTGANRAARAGWRWHDGARRARRPARAEAFPRWPARR